MQAATPMIQRVLLIGVFTLAGSLVWLGCKEAPPPTPPAEPQHSPKTEAVAEPPQAENPASTAKVETPAATKEAPAAVPATTKEPPSATATTKLPLFEGWA